MSTRELPPLQPIGPTLKKVREELGGKVRQIDVGIVLGWGTSAQSKMSNREALPGTPGASDPRPEELVAFEDHYGLQRGTVLRRAGYVTDPEGGPLEIIDSWTFLTKSERELLRFAVEKALERAGEKPSRRPAEDHS